MFWHLFKYGMKSLFRAKEVVFWSLVFPFALATFMYLAFGSIFENTEKFHVIPVAVVEKEEDQVLDSVLSVLSGEGEYQMLKVTKTEEKKAKELLKAEEVTGVIYVTSDPYLLVNENGMDETMLQMILEQIKQQETAVREVLAAHPENLKAVVGRIEKQVSYCTDKPYGNGNQDNVVNYFYAVFAMTCLFASFAICDRVCKLQANACPLGQRRSVTPTHRMMILFAEFVMCELVQFVLTLLLFLYLRFALNVNVGDKYGAIVLLIFIGTSFGTMAGVFVGALPKLSEGTKVGILISISLAFSALSDLMVAGIKDWIEHYVPILNDLNPAVLISDSFYALNVYDTYGRFAKNMAVLLALTCLMAAASYFLVRRRSYENI